MVETFPIDVWCEISGHDYDVWRALRALNRHFKAAISKVDIRGRFDYVYESPDGRYPPKMMETFKRLYVVNTTGHELIVYKDNVEIKICRYEPNGDVWNLMVNSRFGVHGNHKFHEYVGYDADGTIKYCSRTLSVGDVDVMDDFYLPLLCRIQHFMDNNKATIAVPPGQYANFRVNGDFFLYNAPSGRVN